MPQCVQFIFIFFYIFPLKFNTIESISSTVDINSRGLIYKKNDLICTQI